MTTTEEHLGRFYIELQAWIDGGCGEHPTFSIADSICFQLENWAAATGAKLGALESAINDSFEAAGLDIVRPFNSDPNDWTDEYFDDRFYTNPARLAWIKEHAEAAKAAGLAVTA